MSATTSEFSERSFLGIGITLGALLVTGLLCRALQVPPDLTTAVSGTAALVPGGIAYHLQSRRRRRAGVPREATRSGLLTAVLLGCGIVVIDSFAGILVFADPANRLLYVAIEVVLVGVAAALLASRLEPHRYPRALLAVAIALALRLLLVLLFAGDLEAGLGAGTVPIAIAGAVLLHGLMAAAAVLGVYLGTEIRGSSASRPTPREAATTLPPPIGAPRSTEPPVAVASIGAGPIDAPLAPAAPTAPAGWFPDPDLRGVQRWWDGASWTDARRNSPD